MASKHCQKRRKCQLPTFPFLYSVFTRLVETGIVLVNVKQSTKQNEEDHEITENAMFVPYNSTKTRHGDCERIYEVADTDNNQSRREALSLLHNNEISVKNTDLRYKTIK